MNKLTYQHGHASMFHFGLAIFDQLLSRLRKVQRIKVEIARQFGISYNAFSIVERHGF